jgi:thioredoxin 2
MFDEIVRGARLPVLVDFWAAWCEPCQAAAPEVGLAAAQMCGRSLVLKVDTERYPEIAQRFGVRSIPNFVLLKNGQQIAQHAGVLNRTHLVAWIEQAMATPQESVG